MIIRRRIFMRLYRLEFDHLGYPYTQPFAELSHDLQRHRFIRLLAYHSHGFLQLCMLPGKQRGYIGHWPVSISKAGNKKGCSAQL